MKAIEYSLLGDASQLAEHYTSQFLINCYCREVAGPAGLISVKHARHENQNWTEAMGGAARCLLILELPRLRQRIAVGIDAPSLTHNYRFTSGVCAFDELVDPGVALERQERLFLRPVPWDELADLIVRELCARYSADYQAELFDQIKNSKEILEAILRNQQANEQFDGAMFTGMMASEAGLVFGHTFHPAPKSRQGFSSDELALYSPEFSPQFQLHYFAVSPEYVKALAVDSVDLEDFFAQVEQAAGAHNPAGWPLIPCHPWQAQYLSELPEVASALRTGKILDLGVQGASFVPTSSVRTLFSESFPYFIKASLSLRITNSVRKNAYYEIESAVAMSKLLWPIVQSLSHQHPGFSVLLEPVAVTVDLPAERPEDRLDIRSHFGAIFREAVQLDLRGQTVVLAGSLFGEDVRGMSNAALVIREYADARPELNSAKAITQWFKQYVRHLVPPVLQAFFDHGIAFEPHLQNVLVLLHDHSVRGIVLRDLEGTKLDSSRWSGQMLPPMSERAKVSVCHEQEKAWRRIVYCLLINNLCQAVFHCSQGKVPESSLWALVREELKAYMDRDKSALCHRLIGSLLTDESLPCKANLMTRFLQQGDGDAVYIALPNPLLRAAKGECAAISSAEELPV